MISVGCDSIGLRVTTEFTMPWTEITRPYYRRAGLRYASDLTDAEWAMIEPFMPERRRFGRRRSTKLRAVVEAMFYIASTGCQWRQLPKDFPPYSTVQGYFYAWVLDGRWELINHALVMASRQKAGRQASPTAGVIDSQSVQNHGERRPSWLRRRQEDHGPQAAHRHRHGWSSRRTDRAHRQHPGSRWRRGCAGFYPKTLSLVAAHLC